MVEGFPLLAALLGRQPAAALPPANPEAVERALAGILEQGRRALPDVSLSTTFFVEYLAERLAPGGDLLESLAAVHVADLYLACACVQGDQAALAAFERGFLSEVPAFLGRLEATRSLIGDVQQALRAELLVAPPRGLPRLANYQGRGSLASWLRVACIRTALRLRREEQARRGGAEASGPAPVPGVDPELDYIRMLYADDFRRAFQNALARLPAKERNVLRLYLSDGLNIEKIGLVYGVHRATVARWIAASRQKLLAATRDDLRAQLGATETEIESLVRILYDDVDVSIRRHLSPAKE